MKTNGGEVMNREGLNLKIALWVRRVSQADLSQRTGINPGIISLASTGKYNLDQAEKAKIADALNATVQEVFEESRQRA